MRKRPCDSWLSGNRTIEKRLRETLEKSKLAIVDWIIPTSVLLSIGIACGFARLSDSESSELDASNLFQQDTGKQDEQPKEATSFSGEPLFRYQFSSEQKTKLEKQLAEAKKNFADDSNVSKTSFGMVDAWLICGVIKMRSKSFRTESKATQTTPVYIVIAGIDISRPEKSTRQCGF